jgi:transcriptional regulator with XRE-family HTH domain
MGIPENLKRLREREGLSQTGLAKKAGVSQQLISQLEREENVTTKKLPEIARALNATIQEIDPNFAPGGGLGPEGDELMAIYDRLKEYPDWQAYLLEQAKDLELRVRRSATRSPPKAAGDR